MAGFKEAVIALLDEAIVVTLVFLTGVYGLYRSGYLSVSDLLLVLILYFAIAGFVVYKVATAQARRALVGPEALVGLRAEVIEDLDPEGKVLVEGEIWNAVSLTGERVESGRRVRVTGFRGLTLLVVPEEEARGV